MSETSNVPVGHPAKVGVGSQKLHTSAMRDDVSRKSPEACLSTSVMTALSREVTYIPCGAAMVAWPPVFCWSLKRVAVRILLFLSPFVTGPLLLPQGKAVHWFFRQIIADFQNQRNNVSLFYSESLTLSRKTRRQKQLALSRIAKPAPDGFPTKPVKQGRLKITFCATLT